MAKTTASGSGYTGCACGTCFDIAIKDADQPYAFCLACEEAGCDVDGECGCDHEHEDDLAHDHEEVLAAAE